MTVQGTHRPSSKPKRRDPVRDGLVVLCMTVVALALGIGLHLQFALAFWLAVIAALAVYVALLSTHILVRRSERIDELRQEIARLEARAGRGGAKLDGQTARPQTTAGLTGKSGQSATAQAFDGQVQGAGAGEVAPLPPASPAPRGPSLDDYWNFSPAKPPQSPPAAQRVAASQPPSAVPHDETEAEQINAVIKKLAADITQGQANLAREAGPEAAGPEVGRLRPTEMLPPMPVVPPVRLPEIDDSVAALHAAADAMREAGRAFEELRAAPSMVAPTNPSPPPLPPNPVARTFEPQETPAADPARERLAAVASALEREQFDVMLQPILGLSDRRAQHYLVSVRMRGGLADGFDSGAEDRHAPGSGLLPLIDALKVESAARVAWRMEDRSKPGALFSQLSGESLVSDRFLNRFADTYRQGDTLSGRLVMSFRQAEVRAFSVLQWSTLRDMADLGFRFCVEQLSDLDMDFAALAAAGFTFVRLDAEVFLDGLMAEGGRIPAAELCRHFTDLGLAVIVGDIADADVAARLEGLGVRLGHGDLFGAPRPVKADVLRNPHAAVA